MLRIYDKYTAESMAKATAVIEAHVILEPLNLKKYPPACVLVTNTVKGNLSIVPTICTVVSGS